MSSESADVARLQIPVSRALADELAHHAQRLERTQAWLTEHLLWIATDELENFGDWLSERMDRCRRVKRNKGLLQTGDRMEVRLQLFVPPKLAERLERIAEALNNTHLKTAALLLEFALDNERWAMKLLATRMVKAVMNLMGAKREAYKSSEMAEDEGDE